MPSSSARASAGNSRLAASCGSWPLYTPIYTGTVRAYDVVTMLQRDGHPTALGEAIAMYGRIFKTLHILSYIDVDETYPRSLVQRTSDIDIEEHGRPSR